MYINSRSPPYFEYHPLLTTSTRQWLGSAKKKKRRRIQERRKAKPVVHRQGYWPSMCRVRFIGTAEKTQVVDFHEYVDDGSFTSKSTRRWSERGKLTRPFTAVLRRYICSRSAELIGTQLPLLRTCDYVDVGRLW